MKLGMCSSPELAGYGYDEKPWFLPNRLELLHAELERRDSISRIHWRATRAATDDELMRFHPASHIERVTSLSSKNIGALDHGPTLARSRVELAARHAVGAGLDSVDALLAGEHEVIFVPNAGWHHAHAAEARSYCLYNDCVLILQRALERVEGHVFYVDIDVHRGDGVYAAFAEDPRVILVDTHEDVRTLWPNSPESPGTTPDPSLEGEGEGRGFKLNLAFPAGTTDDEFLARWAEVETFLDRFTPRFIVLEAGVDCIGGDEMAHLALSTRAHRAVIASLVARAREHAGGKLLVLAGGGYGSVAAGAWADVIEALLEA